MNISRIICQQDGIVFFSAEKGTNVRLGDTYFFNFEDRRYYLEVVKTEVKTDNSIYDNTGKIFVTLKEAGQFKKNRLLNDVISGDIHINDLLLLNLYYDEENNE